MTSVALLAVVAACGPSKPHMFGSYNDLAPKVAPAQGERIPQHLTVQLARPANVAVFLVAPGRPSRLLFPADSNQTSYVEAGSHLVETSLARLPAPDTSRLNRQPSNPGGNRQPGAGRTGGRGGVGQEGPTSFGYTQHGYLLIFASQEKLSYPALATRVAGLSVPIEDKDALNTVTKLIRETTSKSGPWAAFATDYPP